MKEFQSPTSNDSPFIDSDRTSQHSTSESHDSNEIIKLCADVREHIGNFDSYFLSVNTSSSKMTPKSGLRKFLRG